VRFAVAIVAAVCLVGLAAATIQARSAAVGSAVRLDQQRYLIALSPIRTDLEQSATRMGLAAALYENQDIGPDELQARLNSALGTYEDAGDRLGAMEPPEEFGTVHQAYLDVVQALEQADLEMLKTCDDGDDAHIAAAIPVVLEASGRLADLDRQFWPARVG
jgi:hypothetical protein